MSLLDPTYGPKVHKKDGGNTLVVESGGQIILMPGAKLGPSGVAALPLASAAQAAVVTTAPTSVTPFGFTQTQATAIITLLNQIRTDLIAAGIIKGSA